MSAVEEFDPAEWTEVSNSDDSIEDTFQLNENVRWLRRIEARQAAKREDHTAMRAPLEDELAETDAWLTKQLAPLEDLRLLVLGRIEGWYSDYLEQYPKAGKTVEVPAGTIRSTAGRVSVRVDNEEQAISWAQASGYAGELVDTPEPKPHLVLAAVKKMAGSLPEYDGEEMMVVTSGGEMIPGVVLVHGDRTVKVTTNQVGGR